MPEERLVELIGTFIISLPEPLVAQGRLEDARRLLSIHARLEGSTEFQQRAGYRAAEAVVLRAQGKEREALAAAEEALATTGGSSPADQTFKIAFPQALEATLSLGERERAEQLLAIVDALPPGRLAPSVRAHAARFRARLAAEDGERGKAERGFATAAAAFREYSMPFYLAVTLLEHAEWLIAEGRADDAELLLAEARETFERLGAQPWLERIETAETGSRVEVSV